MNRGLEARAGASATARAAAWAKRLPAPTTNVSKLYLGDSVRPSIVRGGVYSRGAAVGATGGGTAKVRVSSRRLTGRITLTKDSRPGLLIWPSMRRTATCQRSCAEEVSIDMRPS